MDRSVNLKKYSFLPEINYTSLNKEHLRKLTPVDNKRFIVETSKERNLIEVDNLSIMAQLAMEENYLYPRRWYQSNTINAYINFPSLKRIVITANNIVQVFSYKDDSFTLLKEIKVEIDSDLFTDDNHLI